MKLLKLLPSFGSIFLLWFCSKLVYCQVDHLQLRDERLDDLGMALLTVLQLQHTTNETEHVSADALRDVSRIYSNFNSSESDTTGAANTSSRALTHEESSPPRTVEKLVDSTYFQQEDRSITGPKKSININIFQRNVPKQVYADAVEKQPTRPRKQNLLLRLLEQEQMHFRVYRKMLKNRLQQELHRMKSIMCGAIYPMYSSAVKVWRNTSNHLHRILSRLNPNNPRNDKKKYQKKAVRTRHKQKEEEELSYPVAVDTSQPSKELVVDEPVEGEIIEI